MCIPVKLALFIRLTVWGFIQVLAYISSSFLLVTGWYVDIHPHCFQFGVINKAALSICVKILCKR